MLNIKKLLKNNKRIEMMYVDKGIYYHWKELFYKEIKKALRKTIT